MIKKLLVILLSALLCHAAPAKYDQRQDGDLNVKVDLDNFVFVVAIPSTSASTSSELFGSMAQLFSEAKRAGHIVGIPAQQDHQEPATKELDDVSMDTKSETIVVVQEGEKAARSLDNIVRSLRNLKSKEQSGMKEKDKSFSGKYKFVESVQEPQNLRLVGDAIENCGPGRSRDRLGICQSDRDY